MFLQKSPQPAASANPPAGLQDGSGSGLGTGLALRDAHEMSSPKRALYEKGISGGYGAVLQRSSSPQHGGLSLPGARRGPQRAPPRRMIGGPALVAGSLADDQLRRCARYAAPGSEGGDRHATSISERHRVMSSSSPAVPTSGQSVSRKSTSVAPPGGADEPLQQRKRNSRWGSALPRPSWRKHAVAGSGCLLIS